MNRATSEQLLDPNETIRIRGARVHNLRNLDVDVPRQKLVVVTGPSGSGKSSLAFDTLFAEGQRQYIESLSVYARQFLHQLERPDVDLIEGLQPTISIDQLAGSANPRSMVATVAEIYDYLRLFFSRLGDPICYQCGEPIRQQTAEEILEILMDLPPGTRTMILAPMVRGRKGQHKEVFEEIRKAGLLRARVDGDVIDVHEPPALAPQKNHDVEAVVDRVVIREGIRARLAESIHLAIDHGEGAVLVCYEERGEKESIWHDRIFSTLYACPNCKISYEELEPRTFSFNSPYGACPECDGLGSLSAFDPELLVPDAKLSIPRGALAPWRDAPEAFWEKLRKHAEPILEKFELRWTAAWEKWPDEAKELFLKGSVKRFPGVIALLEKEFAESAGEARRRELEAFRGEIVCAACGGARLRPEARSVRLGGKAIHEITAMTVSESRAFFEELEFPEDEEPISRPLQDGILSRLRFLEKVGVEYLTLDRPANALSGGELQRVRLAAGLGSGLVGVCYVLDEPSIGLHPRDNERLIESLVELQKNGNTVVVVEHDETIMRRADWLLDMGPGAGRLGGEIVAQGTPADVSELEDSLTGRFLSGREKIAVPAQRRKISKTKQIEIEGVTTNNLRNVTARFPLSTFICVTGVSGSGKSSLLNETFARAAVRKLGGIAPKPGPFAALRGMNQIDKIVEIDQTPIGRSPRSNPATYTGVFDEIRKVFANSRDAKRRGYKIGRFSFNVKGGRCEECQGQGQKKIEMNFLPDLYVPCPVCEGKRFNRQTLEIRYRDQSIGDVLEMSIDDAAGFFENFSAIQRLLKCLQDVGLGYMSLGQASNTLSGGEAQRIKLAAELSRVDTGKTLYILDEPTTGLHFDDVRKLLDVLHRLVDLGNTVIVIEHNLDVMKTADWIIDLGPEGGFRGGEIVAAGTPEEIAAIVDNRTGQFLKDVLDA